MADVGLAVQQQVIGADSGRVGGQHLRIHRLAVQPLLQVAEGGDGAVAHDQQLAVEDAFEVQRRKHVGKGGRDVFARAAEEATLAALAHRLDADAVPLPFGGVGGGVQTREVHGLVDGLGQHHRPEAAGRVRGGPLAAPFEPGEQVLVGRPKDGPHLLQLGQGNAAQVGRRLLGEARRQADAQAPGQQLQQGPAAVGVQGVKPALDQALDRAARRRRQGVDHLRKLRRAIGAGLCRPDQGHGLGQVAHIVVGPGEQHRVHPRLHRLADRRRLGGAEAQGAGQGGQRPAPVGIGRVLQEVAGQGQLGVARGRQGQPVQQVGEGAHGSDIGANAPSRRPSRGRCGHASFNRLTFRPARGDS